MDYNFSCISIDAIADVEKKLKKACTNIVDDISNFLVILNDKDVVEKKGELITDVSDILRDQMKVTLLQFTETMNKVQRALATYL